MIEVLVATLLGMVSAAAIFGFNRAQLFTVIDQSNQLDVQSAARSILDLFASEMRRACALQTATRTEVRLLADVDGNGTIGGDNEDVTYRYDTDLEEVVRVAGGSSEVLTGHLAVGTSALRYFDGNGVELIPDPSLTEEQRGSVRRVRMELTLSRLATHRQADVPLAARMATDVNIRNRFFVNELPDAAC